MSAPEFRVSTPPGCIMPSKSHFGMTAVTSRQTRPDKQVHKGSKRDPQKESEDSYAR